MLYVSVWLIYSGFSNFKYTYHRLLLLVLGLNLVTAADGTLIIYYGILTDFITKMAYSTISHFLVLLTVIICLVLLTDSFFDLALYNFPLEFKCLLLISFRFLVCVIFWGCLDLALDSNVYTKVVPVVDHPLAQNAEGLLEDPQGFQSNVLVLLAVPLVL